MSQDMTVLTLGAHVLDVLARPVETIPDGQGAALLEQIKASAAGTAGGTALSLAKLGAAVRSAGAIGTDALGDLLLTLLQRGGIDTSLLVRRADVQTSASVLPIRPDGSRPALHVIGANGAYGLDDIPWDALDAVTHLHFGAPEFLGGEAAAKVATYARERGVVCSADLLAPGDPGILAWIEPLLPMLDYLLPNDEQLLGLTATTDLADGARRLVDAGVGCVVVTRGAAGALAVDADSVTEIPAFDVSVVDTSGCGDAFSAGFLRGVALGRTVQAAAVLGCATAALVAGGLGSDHGDFDLAAVDAFAASTGVRGA
jgi:sugar/nucleoside kinase (ribokinase family)